MVIIPDPILLLQDLTKEYAGAKPGLYHWRETTEAGDWNTPEDVKKSFNSVDFVKVSSGLTVAVFNISGKKFRLIARILYDQKKVLYLLLLPHHIYSKNRWVHEL
jgi:mRNA interferase HigB